MALSRKKNTSDPAAEALNSLENDLESEMALPAAPAAPQQSINHDLPVPHIFADGRVANLHVGANGALPHVEITDGENVLRIASMDQAFRLAQAITIAAKLRWQT